MSIQNYVNVQISIEADTVSRTGFGTMLLYSQGVGLDERVKEYASVNEMIDDGFPSDSVEVDAATLYFGQPVKPNTLVVGRRLTDLVEVVIDSAVSGEEYSLLIDGDQVTYTAGPTDTVADISDALTTEIQGLGGNVTASDQSGSIDVTNVDSNIIFGITITSGSMSLSTVVFTETLVEGLQKIQETNDDFYGITVLTKDESNILDLAAYVETQKKLLGLSSNDEDILGSGSTDFASTLSALEYARTFLLYHPDGDTIYPESAWFGNQLPFDAGSTTWAFKTLVGVTPYKLTQSQRSNTLSKNCNIYELVNGIGITADGKVVGDEYIDIIIGVDWIQARLKEGIFGVFVSSPKISYTNPGKAVIENKIAQILDQAIERNILPANPRYVITNPPVSQASTADKQNRVVTDMSFTATLAGAIQSVNPLVGTVSV